jgi:hypothetical protein
MNGVGHKPFLKQPEHFARPAIGVAREQNAQSDTPKSR